MSFFSKLMSVTPLRKAEKRFDRARRAESLARYDEAEEQFGITATAFDEHFADLRAKSRDPRPSELVKAGIAYTRLGRNEDALQVLDECMRQTEIPDAFFHAGFAAAQLGRLDETIRYWTDYPDWYEQKFMHRALREQLRQLRGPQPDLAAACEAMMKAFYRQDTENRAQTGIQHRGDPFPPNRGY